MKRNTDPALRKLIVGQMALHGMNALTIEFMVRVFDLISDENGVNCVQMAGAASITRATAQRYVHRLQQAGYLKRLSWRSWRLSEDAITDPDLKFFASVRNTMSRIAA